MKCWIKNGLTLLKCFYIYPNPANGRVTFSRHNKAKGESLVSIFDLQGIKKMQGAFQNQDPVELDVSRLVKGFYIVKMQTEEGIETGKLVIR